MLQVHLNCRSSGPLVFAHITCAALLLLVTLGCQPKAVTKGRMHIQNGDWQLALKELEYAVEAYPDNEEAHFLLGFVYGQNERYADMMTAFDASLKISDKFEEKINAERERHWKQNFNQGIRALDAGNFLLAERKLRWAIVVDTSKHDAHKKLAAGYVKNDRLEDALELYGKLLENYPDEVGLLLAVVDVHIKKKQLQEVIPYLQHILEIEPKHRDALSKLAEIADTLGKSKKAEETYQQALEAYPNDRELILRFGVHYYQRKNFEHAIQLFERVLELDQNDFEATSNIGNAYLSLAENLRKQLKASNNGSRPANDLQKIRDRALFNYRKAIPYLRKAVDMRPILPDLWRNLGVAYLQTGERQKGEEAFLKAEKLTLELSK